VKFLGFIHNFFIASYTQCEDIECLVGGVCILLTCNSFLKNRSQNVRYTRYSEADSLCSESSLGVVELREFRSERNYDVIHCT
jgi:hypothetical protein